MDQLMTKEESYAERRKLFKNIWKTAMDIDDKDGEIINKTKVIKTLRLDEVDRCMMGKKKKQRIKNLRHVCNKILDFCDRQDADDSYYSQIENLTDTSQPQETDCPIKKTKHRKLRRKIKKTKSMRPPINNNIFIDRASGAEETQVFKAELTIPLKKFVQKDKNIKTVNEITASTNTTLQKEKNGNNKSKRTVDFQKT